MSILPSHSLTFISNKTTAKPSFAPCSDLPSFKKRSPFSLLFSFSSFNDEYFVPKPRSNKTKQNGKQSPFVDEWGEKSESEPRTTTKLSDSDPPRDDDEWGGAETVSDTDLAIYDEWGEKSGPEPQPLTTLSDSDPPINDDEWTGVNNGDRVDVRTTLFVENSELEPQMQIEEKDKVVELKRRLLDTVYGTEFGLRASVEVRAQALELVSQLEAVNPTLGPVESPELLDGNWILVFTAFSELLPLQALAANPLLKIVKISQAISTESLTIENSATISSPVATSSFSATAAFEVQSPSRIQVEFKDGTFNPPVIQSKIGVPENVDIHGQKINLSPLQQSLGPVENTMAGIARAVSGLPPLKIPIPGEHTKSWLVTTFLDKDMRISRGGGGLFVLVKEDSTLLDR